MQITARRSSAARQSSALRRNDGPSGRLSRPERLRYTIEIGLGKSRNPLILHPDLTDASAWGARFFAVVSLNFQIRRFIVHCKITVVVDIAASPFQLQQPFSPAGDQPQAIAKLIEGISDGLAYQTLLGVTGSGKTYTMANVIARLGRPALVLAPNKTLADRKSTRLNSSHCTPPRMPSSA